MLGRLAQSRKFAVPFWDLNSEAKPEKIRMGRGCGLRDGFMAQQAQVLGTSRGKDGVIDGNQVPHLFLLEAWRSWLTCN